VGADSLAYVSEPSTNDDVVLDVHGLAKRYPGATSDALHALDLQLYHGEVLGLLGPNGAGKSTAIEIISGFRTADSGAVRVLGRDPSRPRDLREIRQLLALVSQHTGHLRYQTVRETLAMHATWYEQPRGIDEVLELVELHDAQHQRVRRLSGGQQRRLDLAVALMGRPKIVLLDEPTTGFDPAARRRAWDVVERLAADGTSILLTTHYMEEATRLADRVVVLAAGRVVGEGSPDQLARELQLGTVIRARIPEALVATDLPTGLRDGLVEAGRFELHAPEPTRALAALCGWAVDRGLSLEELDVRAPSLEDSYLALTETSS
jgi:ABC-2 type transport system ATP-binding protein